MKRKIKNLRKKYRRPLVYTKFNCNEVEQRKIERRREEQNKEKIHEAPEDKGEREKLKKK